MTFLPPLEDAARISCFLADQPVPRPQAATVDKLRMPFRLLADPGGRQAIRPYRVWHEGNPYARPAVIIVAPGGPAEALPVLD